MQVKGFSNDSLVSWVCVEVRVQRAVTEVRSKLEAV